MASVQELIKEYEASGKESLLHDLKEIVVQSKSVLEGNSFYIHQTLEIYPELYTKQLNLFWCGKQVERKLCEIGFNAGHSAMLFLLSNKTPFTFTIFDICEHNYVKPSFEYIKSKFPDVSFELIEGDSTKTVSKWISEHQSEVGQYDVVHVDGGHQEHCVISDMENADRLVKVGGYIIVDDTQCPHINHYADLFISSGRFVEIDIFKTTGYCHRIIKKVK